jgi:predicted nucleotidyltransferase
MRPWLQAEGVLRVRVVGSHARDEARPDGDIDLLVEFRDMPGLRFFQLERELSERLGGQSS